MRMEEECSVAEDARRLTIHERETDRLRRDLSRVMKIASKYRTPRYAGQQRIVDLWKGGTESTLPTAHPHLLTPEDSLMASIVNLWGLAAVWKFTNRTSRMLRVDGKRLRETQEDTSGERDRSAF